MNTPKIRHLLFNTFPFLAWCGLIFYSSSQPYTKQDLRPLLSDYDLSWADKWLSGITFFYSDMEISIKNLGAAHFIEFFIRKSAHLFVFMLLGILAYRVIQFYIKKNQIKFVASFLFVFIYASIDEYRHLLHPNRTGLIEDVVIDCIGGLIGILLWMYLEKFFKKQRNPLA